MPAPPTAKPTSATAGDGARAGSAPDQERPVGETARLAEEAPGRHRAAEDAGAEAADRGMRVQLPLEEERAPALHPALDEERRGAREAEDDERPLERQPEPAIRRRPARPLLSRPGKGRRGEEDQRSDREQDRLAARAGA